MADKLKIMLVGDLTPRGTAAAFENVFKKQGHELVAIHVPELYTPSWLNRFVNHTLSPIAPTPDYWGVGHLNLEIEARVGSARPDLVVFFQPLYVRPQTYTRLREIGPVAIFNHFAGDAFARNAASRFYFESLPEFDCHFITESVNVTRLRHNKAKRIVVLPPLIPSAVIPGLLVNDEDRKRFTADVGVVGNAGPRYKWLDRLAREGVKLKIIPAEEGLSPQEAQRATNCFSLSVAFANQFTTRGLEVLVQGGFLLQEPTEEAKELLNEGVEVEFFRDYDELKRKITFYLNDRAAREAIAKKGHERILRPDLSFDARAKAMLSEYRQIVHSPNWKKTGN